MSHTFVLEAPFAWFLGPRSLVYSRLVCILHAILITYLVVVVVAHRYATELDRPYWSSVKTSQIAGVAFGASEMMTFSMFWQETPCWPVDCDQASLSPFFSPSFFLRHTYFCMPSFRKRSSPVPLGLMALSAPLIPVVMWAIAFGYGSVLVQDGDCTFDSMMKSISALAFGAMMLGQVG